jgi:hypothetical protein
MAASPIPEMIAAATALANGEDSLYEIVNGQRAEKPFMSVYGIRIAFLLARYVDVFAETKKLGRVIVEAIFGLPLARGLQQHRPDAASVRESAAGLRVPCRHHAL